jgi:hypothetical protein
MFQPVLLFAYTRVHDYSHISTPYVVGPRTRNTNLISSCSTRVPLVNYSGPTRGLQSEGYDAWLIDYIGSQCAS